MNEVVITGAVRTPIGSFNGGLGSVSAVDLGTIAIKEALSRSSVSPDDVNEVIFGQVLTAGCGQNPARQSAVHAGIPASSSAVTVNQVCGSGLRTVAMAYQAIRSGDSSIVVAGGQESMSLSTHCAHLRNGYKMGNAEVYIKAGTTAETLAKLRPAFSKEGSVTAGNASGLNDGAAALVVMSRDEAEKRGAPVLARIVSYATVGVDPEVMGSGPIPASQAALEKAGWTVDDLDLIEANEAFAAQACAVNKDMGWDTAKVNVNGGAIALGHPIGASGARVLITLLHEMQRQDAKKGLATLCIGGGMGIALCVERS